MPGILYRGERTKSGAAESHDAEQQRPVFVDATAIGPLVIPSHRDHAALLGAFRRAVAGRRPLLTTNYQLVEAVRWLRSGAGPWAVADLDASIVPLLEVRWVGADLHGEAVRRLVRTGRSEPTLAHEVAFFVIEAAGVQEVLALDVEFTVRGYRVIPGVRGP